MRVLLVDGRHRGERIHGGKGVGTPRALLEHPPRVEGTHEVRSEELMVL